ncbi:MAG TPA: YqgE/AlgH family protein [Prolixibacteraceae bacterium]|nr:YqgE/AlgH family protein [Prolixibacteraceae bacterium]
MNLNLDIFKIKSNNVVPKKGRILIAEPFLPGSYFNRSIVYIVEHNANGTVGFILNKPVDFQVKDFQNEFPTYEDKIYIGGPVSIESLYYIHSFGRNIEGSIHIQDNLYWGGNFEQIKSMINDQIPLLNQIRFFLGYSGWDKEQLKEELNEDSWLVADIAPELVLSHDKELWSEMVKEQGGKYKLWQNFPENPSMN